MRTASEQPRRSPQAAKAQPFYWPYAARLKPCPFKAAAHWSSHADTFSPCGKAFSAERLQGIDLGFCSTWRVLGHGPRRQHRPQALCVALTSFPLRVKVMLHSIGCGRCAAASSKRITSSPRPCIWTFNCAVSALDTGSVRVRCDIWSNDFRPCTGKCRVAERISQPVGVRLFTLLRANVIEGGDRQRVDRRRRKQRIAVLENGNDPHPAFPVARNRGGKHAHIAAAVSVASGCIAGKRDGSGTRGRRSGDSSSCSARTPFPQTLHARRWTIPNWQPATDPAVKAHPPSETPPCRQG